MRGIYVRTVIERTDPPDDLTNNGAIGARVLVGGQRHQFTHTCAVNGIYPATDEPIDLVYHRLHIWDNLPTEGLARRQRTSPPARIPRPGLISYEFAKDGLVHGAGEDIGMSIILGTTRKRMFKTDSVYMGLAHRSVEIGDKVYALMGGETPYILRSLGGQVFGFGDEAYVHGIMDGEILAIARTKKEGLRNGDSRDLA